MKKIIRSFAMRGSLAALGLFVLLLGLPAPGAAQVDHYAVRAVIDPPAGRLRAESTVSFTAVDSATSWLEVWLNRGLALESVQASVPVRAVVRDSARRGGTRWAGEAEPVRVELEQPLEPGEGATVTFRYDGEIVPDQWGANVLTEAWVELAMYCAWYPLVPGDRAFTYTIAARVPADYRMTGLGRVAREGPEAGAGSVDAPGSARYRVVQDAPVNDMVVAGSRRLRTRVVDHDGFAIRLSHVDLEPAQLDRIAADAADALERFGGWFGPSQLRDLEFLFVPRESGGGYARPGLVVMQFGPETDVAGAGFLRYLGHEVAHLWWRAASTENWQDWLNESFAEYGALMLLRERIGPAEFERRIDDYRAEAASTPPIRGIDRGHDDAFTVLYRKGPVLLHELELRLGDDTFLAFLRALRDEDVEDTDRLLEVLERVGSPADRAWLDAALDRTDV